MGGGGHGLATAYYLAKNHGITDVCVVEKGWLAGGNMARNTTIIRSNYLWDESAAIYEHSLKLWEGLEEELGSTSSSASAACSTSRTTSARSARRAARQREPAERGGRGVAHAEEVAAFCPIVNISPDVRYPVLGATLQRRGGIARHDKVAWAYATAATSSASTSSSTPRSRGSSAVRAAGWRASRRRAGEIRGEKVALVRRGAHARAGVDGRTSAAAAVPPAAGAGERAATSRSSTAS